MQHEISAREFKEMVYDYATSDFIGQRPVVVDLYTQWCSACKVMAPGLKALHEKYIGSVDVIKVDVTEADDLVAAFSVQSVPTLLFFKPGEGHSKTLVGAHPSTVIEKALQGLLQGEVAYA
jgi:thioredoxin